MKSRKSKYSGVSAGISFAIFLMAGPALAAGSTWAEQHQAPAAPPISQDSCDAFKVMKMPEIQQGQHNRDYMDQQYVYYRSVAQSVYTQIQARLDQLQVKYKKELSAVNQGILSDDEVNNVETEINKDFTADLFAPPYTFCPENSVQKIVKSDGYEPYVDCVPVKGKWQSETWNGQPQGPQRIVLASFKFEFHKKPDGTKAFANGKVPGIFLSIGSAEQDEESQRGVSTDVAAFSANQVLKSIWPGGFSDNPGFSLRPEAILAQKIHDAGCDRYEPGYKSSTVKVNQPKVVDERTGKVITGSGGKTESAPAGQ
jgi:hypothetical protein